MGKAYQDFRIRIEILLHVLCRNDGGFRVLASGVMRGRELINGVVRGSTNELDTSSLRSCGWLLLKNSQGQGMGYFADCLIAFDGIKFGSGMSSLGLKCPGK
jgi:hypothetical protein